MVKYIYAHVKIYLRKICTTQCTNVHRQHTHNVGSFVAVLDAPVDNHYHIAKILSIDKTTTRVHYYVTHPTAKSNVETFTPDVPHKPSRHESTRHHREGPNQVNRCHQQQSHGRGTHNISQHRRDGRHENQ